MKPSGLVLDTGACHGFQDLALAQNEDQDRNGHNHNGNGGHLTGTGDTASLDLLQSEDQGLFRLGVDDRASGVVPQALHGEDDDRQPGRLYVGHHDAPEDAELAGAVDVSGFDQGGGQTLHELLHHEQTDGSSKGGQQQGPVSVDHAQLGHDHVVRDTRYVAGEHQGGGDHVEEEAAAGEVVLGQNEGRHGGDDQVAEGTNSSDKHRVDNVAAEGHPALAHGNDQVREVVQRGMLGENRGRETEELIQRLQGGADSEHQRESHQAGHGSQHDVDADITADGTVGMAALDQVLLRLDDALAAHFGQTVKLFSTTADAGLVVPHLVHVVVDLQAVGKHEDVFVAVLHLHGDGGGHTAVTDVLEDFHFGIGEFQWELFACEASDLIFGDQFAAVFLPLENQGTAGLIHRFTHIRYPPFPVRQKLPSCTES